MNIYNKFSLCVLLIVCLFFSCKKDNELNLDDEFMFLIDNHEGILYLRVIDSQFIGTPSVNITESSFPVEIEFKINGKGSVMEFDKISPRDYDFEWDIEPENKRIVIDVENFDDTLYDGKFNLSDTVDEDSTSLSRIDEIQLIESGTDQKIQHTISTINIFLPK